MSFDFKNLTYKPVYGTTGAGFVADHMEYSLYIRANPDLETIKTSPYAWHLFYRNLKIKDGTAANPGDAQQQMTTEILNHQGIMVDDA